MWSYGKIALLFVIVAVMAVATYLGGPLYFSDELEATAGRLGALTVSGVPVLVAGVGAFSLWRTHPWNLGRWAVTAGLLALALISAMNTFVAVQIMAQWPAADGELLVAGMSAGALSALAYLVLALRRFRQ
jgi:hypothetical protein